MLQNTNIFNFPKKAIISTLLVFGFNLLSAQLFLDWGKNYGGSGYEMSHGIATDGQNNVYVIGDFWIKCDFDPSSDTLYIRSEGFGTDAYVQKLDSLGNLIWVRKISGPFHDEGTAIAVSPEGSVYAAGAFVDSADFDPDTSRHIEYANGSNDMYILKLDPSGSLNWVNAIGGPGVETIASMVLDDTLNLYACGSFTDTLDFSPNTGSRIIESKGLYDGFVQKLDSSGKHIWTFSFGSSGFDVASDIVVDKTGNSWVTGYFSDTLTIGPNKLISNGKEDVVILKINSKGSLVWMKQIGGLGVDKGLSISLDKNDLPYLTGTFENSIYLNPISTGIPVSSKGGKDVFLVGLDINGNFRWGQTWGGSAVEQPCKLVINSNNELFCFGQFFDRVDFDPGNGVEIGNSLMGVDAFISKFDTRGNFISFQQFGGIGDIKVNDVTLNSSDNILSTGGFQRDLDIDPTHRKSFRKNVGAEDVFIQQLKSNCASTVDTITANNCLSYSAASGKAIWNQSGTYLDTLYSKQNCDSVLVVHLTISNPARDTAKLDACAFFIPKGSTKRITLSGLYIDTVSSITGCDSLIVLELSIHQNSQFSYAAAACGNYTSPSGNTRILASGTIMDTISNAAGCDSMLTINVTVYPTFTQLLNSASCKPITSPSKKHLWTTTGVYFDTLTTTNGCDSILQIQVEINALNSTITTQGSALISNQPNQPNPSEVSYQWVKCDANFTLIPAAEQKGYTPIENGDYAVIVTKNGCSDTSACITVNAVSNNSNYAYAIESYRIQPNPFKNSFTVFSASKNVATIELINSIGQIVLSKQEVRINENIKLELPTGIYYLRILSYSDQNETQIFKLIKQ